MTSLNDLQKRAVEVAAKYAELNVKRGEQAWGPKDRMMGFVTDVGELNELVMAKEGVRHDVDDVDSKLAHELCDCLWSVLVLADTYKVDLDAAFAEAMDQLDERIARG